MGTIADDQRAPLRAGHASTFSRVLVRVFAPSLVRAALSTWSSSAAGECTACRR